MGLEVLPEELAEKVGELFQGGVVDRRLPFVQVADQEVADRGAGQVVLADELSGGELSLEPRVEHAQRRRRVRREQARRVQQRVEADALAAAAVAGIAGLCQLQAVADRDVGERAALGRDDDRQVLHGQAAGVVADPGPVRAFLQGLEPGAVPQAGHLPAEREPDRAADQPLRAGPDRIGVDQLPEPERHGFQEHGAVARVASSGEPVHDFQPPVRGAVAGDAASLPALLPGISRMPFQPAQEAPQREPAAVQLPGGFRIGRGQQPARQRRPAQRRRFPGVRKRPGRELLQQGGCGFRPHPGAQRSPGLPGLRPWGSHPCLPNSTSSDSGR